MEIKSPGLFVEPITLESLLTRTSVHASRNPLFVRVLADYGLMREEGEGIPRMFEEMESYYLKLPDLDIADNIFRVTLWNTPRFPVLRRLLSTKKTMSNTEYRKIFGMSRYQSFP